MIDGLSRIFKRINDINQGSKQLVNTKKPEMVREFEKKLQNAISSNNNINTKNEAIHPLLEKNVKIDKTPKDQKSIINEAIKRASNK